MHWITGLTIILRNPFAQENYWLVSVSQSVKFMTTSVRFNIEFGSLSIDLSNHIVRKKNEIGENLQLPNILF